MSRLKDMHNEFLSYFNYRKEYSDSDLLNDKVYDGDRLLRCKELASEYDLVPSLAIDCIVKLLIINFIISKMLDITVYFSWFAVIWVLALVFLCFASLHLLLGLTLCTIDTFWLFKLNIHRKDIKAIAYTSKCIAKK